MVWMIWHTSDKMVSETCVSLATRFPHGTWAKALWRCHCGFTVEDRDCDYTWSCMQQQSVLVVSVFVVAESADVMIVQRLWLEGGGSGMRTSSRSIRDWPRRDNVLRSLRPMTLAVEIWLACARQDTSNGR